MLGFLAAGLHWLAALILIIGAVTSEGSHSEEWTAKYPEWNDRMMVRLFVCAALAVLFAFHLTRACACACSSGNEQLFSPGLGADGDGPA